MKNLSLPKRFQISNKEYPFFHNDNWISNGHFMIKKELVKDSFKYCHPNERAIVELDRIFPQTADSEWKKTDIIYDCGKLGYLRVFKNEELNKTICFKDDYIQHFNLNSLKGNWNDLNSPFVSLDGSFVIMACRNNNTDFT